MRWAVLDSRNVVTSVVEQESKPANSVKAPNGSGYGVGRIWNGWTFDAPRWQTFDFLNRFTQAELDDCLAAAEADEDVRRFLAFCEAAHEVIADDPTTVAGMDYLVSALLLTSARRDEILAA